jgi:hypothetical protein
MAAAPLAIAKDATIVNGDMKAIRQGTNGWTCMPDLPTSPGTDPMCLDKNGMEWAHALMTKAQPPKGKMGIGYMLMGGSDASNTDPFATKPSADGKWVDTGPAHDGAEHRRHVRGLSDRRQRTQRCRTSCSRVHRTRT